jgi:hypothetical protein
VQGRTYSSAETRPTKPEKRRNAAGGGRAAMSFRATGDKADEPESMAVQRLHETLNCFQGYELRKSLNLPPNV